MKPPTGSVLITSPHRRCEYFVGSLDLQRVKFAPEPHAILDVGDACASNISQDNQGRTILWLWGRTNTPQGRGWNGMMTRVALGNFIDSQAGDQAISALAQTGNCGFGNSEKNRRPASVLESLKAWPMKPASCDLDHFHF